LRPPEALYSQAFITLPAVVLFSLVTLLCRVGVRLAALPMSRDASIRLLAVMVWLSLTGGFTLYVSNAHPDWSGLLLMAAALPLALPLSSLAVRLSARRGGGISVGLVILLALVIVSYGTSTLRAYRFHPAAQVAAISALIALLGGVALRFRRLGWL